jgi:hypothetical protein
MGRWVVTISLMGLVACSDAVGQHAGVPPLLACDGEYQSPKTVGRLPAIILSEVSGIATSRVTADSLWLHNDSGDAARLFAVDTEGQLRGELHLQGVVNTDFEDLATSRCPDSVQGCLWVADIGNNLIYRPVFTVHVVPEPSLAELDPHRPLLAQGVVSLRFRYPEEPIDSEALVVAADGARFWTIEKTDRPVSRIYEYSAPFVDSEVVEVMEVGLLPVPGVPVRFGQLISGADLHPSGTRLLVRVYSGVYEYSLATPWDLTDLDGVAARRVVAGPFSEPQGEAVAYDAGGLGLWTVSEDRTGVGRQPLHHYSCLSE